MSDAEPNEPSENFEDKSPSEESVPHTYTDNAGLFSVIAIVIALFAFGYAFWTHHDYRADKHAEQCDFYAEAHRTAGLIERCMDRAKSRDDLSSLLGELEADKNRYESEAASARHALWEFERSFCKHYPYVRGGPCQRASGL